MRSLLALPNGERRPPQMPLPAFANIVATPDALQPCLSWQPPVCSLRSNSNVSSRGSLPACGWERSPLLDPRLLQCHGFWALGTSWVGEAVIYTLHSRLLPERERWRAPGIFAVCRRYSVNADWLQERTLRAESKV